LQDGATFADPTKFVEERLADPAHAALPTNAFVPQGGGPPEGHRCPGETLIELVMPAFLGWFTRRYDLTFPAQVTTPGGGGLGPLPRDGLRVTITPRTIG
nr:cytochrome P450 [Deltaproteobacteria bacterium]